jgi:hypothetical protein
MRQIRLFALSSVLLTFMNSRSGAQTNERLLKIVDEMSQSNVYEMSYTVGFAGSLSKQYERFNQLVASATSEQLLDYAQSHTSPVVRLYAFQALKHQKVAIPEAIVQRFKVDTTTVATLRGCEGGRQQVRMLAAQDFGLWGNLHQ